MSEFSSHKVIAFCRVDKNLLAEIEAFLLNKVSTLVNIPENKLIEEYRVSIEDDSGTEEFRSIREYSFELLPDKTREISLRLNVYSPKVLRIRVTFKSGETAHSCISITYKAENAKMVAKEIQQHVNTLLHQSSNHNEIFHPVLYGLTPTLALMASTALSTVGVFIDSTTSVKILLPLSALFLLTYTATGTWLRPIISFDSKRSRTLDSFGRWAFGVLIMLIVGILSTAIWKLSST